MTWIDVTTLPGFSLVRDGANDAKAQYSVVDGEIVVNGFFDCTDVVGNCYVPRALAFTFDGDGDAIAFSALQIKPILDSVDGDTTWATTFSFADVTCTGSVYMDQDDPALGTWIDMCPNTRLVGVYNTAASSGVSADIHFRLQAELTAAPAHTFWTRNVNCTEHA